MSHAKNPKGGPASPLPKTRGVPRPTKRKLSFSDEKEIRKRCTEEVKKEESEDEDQDEEEHSGDRSIADQEASEEQKEEDHDGDLWSGRFRKGDQVTQGQKVAGKTDATSVKTAAHPPDCNRYTLVDITPPNKGSEYLLNQLEPALLRFLTTPSSQPRGMPLVGSHL